MFNLSFTTPEVEARNTKINYRTNLGVAIILVVVYSGTGQNVMNVGGDSKGAFICCSY